MTRRRWLAVTAVALVGLAALHFGRYWWLPQLGHWLDTGQQSAERADYAFVLGGDINTRPLAAAALYKAGTVHAVLVSRVSTNQATRDGMLPPQDETTTRLLIARGLPPTAIEPIGNGSDTTYDEAGTLREFLATHDKARVIIVTNFYHTRRAAWIMRRVLGDVSRVSVVSAPAATYTADDWWHDEEGFQAIPREYAGLLFYQFRYGWAGAWLGAAVLAGVVWCGVRLWRKRAAANPSQCPS